LLQPWRQIWKNFFKGKLDVYVEQATRKVANYLGDVLEDQREKLLENLMANGMDLATYLTKFQWDMAKYPIKQSLKNLSDMIAKQVENPEVKLVCDLISTVDVIKLSQTYVRIVVRGFATASHLHHNLVEHNLTAQRNCCVLARAA